MEEVQDEEAPTTTPSTLPPPPSESIVEGSFAKPPEQQHGIFEYLSFVTSFGQAIVDLGKVLDSDYENEAILLGQVGNLLKVISEVEELGVIASAFFEIIGVLNGFKFNKDVAKLFRLRICQTILFLGHPRRGLVRSINDAGINDAFSHPKLREFEEQLSSALVILSRHALPKDLAARFLFRGYDLSKCIDKLDKGNK